LINKTDAFEVENLVATETAIGALGKIVMFQNDGSNVTDATSI
jgi:hypothetical protein